MSKKYNNADSTLAGDLQASGSSFVLKTGEGDLFPPTGDAPYELTHEHYEGSVVTKREILTISARTGDAFTISARKSQICVQDDSVDPKTRTQNALSFSSGDRVYMTINEDDFNDIETEINTNIPATYTTKTETTALETKIKESSLVYAATSTGSDDYAITISGLTSYKDGMTFRLKVDVANTGTATLNVNGLGAIALKKNQGQDDLVDGDIAANGIVTATYNSTGPVFQFVGQEATVVSSEVEKTTSSGTLGETVSIGDAVCVDSTDGKLYKTDASNTARINFVGFADGSGVLDDVISFNTNGVDNNQTLSTIGADQYLTHGLTNSNSVVQNLSDTANEFSHDHVGQTITLSGQSFVKVNSCTWKGYANTSGETATMRCKIYDAVDGNLIATSDQTFDLAYQSVTTCAFTFTADDYDEIPGGLFIAIEREAGISVIASRVSTSNNYAGGRYYVNDGSWVADDVNYDMYFDLDVDVQAIDSDTGVIGENIYGTAAPVKVGKALSATELEIQNNNDGHLTGISSSTATAGGLTPPNITEYITIKVNGVDRKIGVYAI